MSIISPVGHTGDPVSPLGGMAAISVLNIEPSPNNPRKHLEDIEGLALSIRENGLIQPLVVQPETTASAAEPVFRIVAGHRRYAAVLLLGWQSVPCIIRKPMREDAELLAMLVENGQRAGLDPIEEARALARLKHDMGINEAEVARRIGRHPSHVTGRIMLLALPFEEQESVRAGVTTLTEAKAKARISSGRIRKNAIGRPGVGHFSTAHPLAAKVKARCIHLGHLRGKGKGVGGVACGECWEVVLLAAQGEQLQGQLARTGVCPTCDHRQGAS